MADRFIPQKKKPQTGIAGKGQRLLHTRVKTARGRKSSSTLWLQRQLNDPYVVEAQRLGYRSRAAFKLVELNDKLSLLRPGMTVVDLGAAPGGWSQVAAEIVGKKGQVVGIDLQEIDPLPPVIFLQGDITEEENLKQLQTLLKGPVDLILSDMAASSTGHKKTDNMRVITLLEIALDFSEEVLRPGGTFVGKVLIGGAEQDLLNRLKKNFTRVRHVKPDASRKDSTELYLVAQGYKSNSKD